MRKSITLLLVLAFLTASYIVTIQPAKASENSWLTRPPMPKGEFGLVVAVANGRIYAIAANGANEEYNPATLTWTTKESIPTPRGAPGIAVYQNKIYVIGGTNGFDPATGIPILCAVNQVYDPLTNTWETIKSMPTPRSGLDANVVNGKIYLIGGVKDTNTGEASNLNEVYDPATDSWTTKTPIPTPVFSYSSAVVENKIYVISGSTTGQGTTNLTQIYDPATDTWSSGKSPLTPVAGAAAAATTGMFAPKRIYLIGGRTATTGISLNQVYDPETDQWSWGASMTTPRYGLAIAVVNDTLYALGGVSFGPLQGTVYAANELYIPFGYEGPFPPYWSPTPDTPSSTSGQITISASGDVEGTDKIQRDGDVYLFTGSISGSIAVERDDVILDGAGYDLQPQNDAVVGVDISDRNNVTIRNVAITNFQTGINLESTTQSKLINNNITTYTYEDGIKLTNSTNNIISNNIIYSYAYPYSTPFNRGIALENCSKNTISENRVTGNFYGIYLHLSNNNTLSGNSITKSNFGIDLYLSSNNNLAGNTVFSTVLAISRGVHSDSGTGIWLEVNSTYNQVHKNNVKNNGEAMRIWDYSSNNIIYENNFINNTNQISIITRGIPDPQSIPIPNSWDNGTVGNYWSDYQTKYPNATEIDNSGMGNAPYLIDANNIDNHPLMKPVAIPEFPDGASETETEPFSTPLLIAIILVAIAIGALAIGLVLRKRQVQENKRKSGVAGI